MGVKKFLVLLIVAMVPFVVSSCGSKNQGGPGGRFGNGGYLSLCDLNSVDLFESNISRFISSTLGRSSSQVRRRSGSVRTAFAPALRAAGGKSLKSDPKFGFGDFIGATVNANNIRKVVDRLVSEFEVSVWTMRCQIDEFRGQIQSERATLDPNNPRQAGLFRHLERMGAEVDRYETELRINVQRLVDDLASIRGKLDRANTGNIPGISLILMSELYQISKYLVEVESRVAATKP